MKEIHDEMERRDQKQTEKLNQIISMIRENPKLAKVKAECTELKIEQTR